MTELKRDLGIWAALAIVVGTVIGSGIFRVPQAMILNVGSVPLVFLVWVVGGLLSLAGALTYAELAAAMPGAAGEYVYLTEGYGPFWGFVYGWTQMWVAKSGSIAILPPTAYWRGAVDGNWTTPQTGVTNWTLDSAGTTDTHIAPGASTDVFFVGAGAQNLSTTLRASFSIKGLTFTSTATAPVVFCV